MGAALTDDEIDKKVIDAEGKELGIVVAVEDSVAYVDPNPSLAEHAMAKVGWEDVDEEDYTVTEDMLDRVGEAVVLRGEI